MAQMSTPGVYLQELDAFGNSVVPVPTAVPAFIGYTQQTSYNGQDLTFQPVVINSLTDFLTLFGSAAPQVQYGMLPSVVPASVVTASAANAAASYAVTTGPNAVSAAVVTALSAIKVAIDTAATAAAIATELTAANAELTTVTNATPQVSQDMNAATAVLNYANVKGFAITFSTGTVGTALAAATTAANASATATSKASFLSILNTLASASSVKSIQAQINAAEKVATPAATDVTAQTDIVAYAQLLATAIANADFWSNGIAYSLGQTTINYRLYGAIKLFYDNGGGQAYIYSIGPYDFTQTSITDTSGFQTALDLLAQETVPTMLVIPDAIEVKNLTGTSFETTYALCYSLQNQMLDSCGTTMNRIAILDVPGGWTEPLTGETSVEAFRNQVNPSLPDFNSYGAAYYPWLNTTIYQSSDVSATNIDTVNVENYANVFALLSIDLGSGGAIPYKMIPYVNAFSVAATAITTAPALTNLTPGAANAALYSQSTSYQLLINAIITKMNLMAPSAAMAGLYTTVDNNEGVWYAPANIGVQSVISPSLKVDDNSQQDLNVPIDGKSICAIRSFTGRGTLVWGARTLDGNSDDWRYINVRRTMMYIEQSVKDAAFAYVFAPNVAGTWIDVQSMITNFLTGLWSQGGLAGSKPETAFSVAVGLNSTMTSQDILDGVMRVSVKVAISHPAEFIVITFEQQMQS